MEQISLSLEHYTSQKPTARSERESILNEFWHEINLERKGTKYKPFGTHQKRIYAIKLNQAFKDTWELRQFLSECKDYKNRNGSFGRRFFGGFK